jgi:hypothetical protein
VFRAMVLKTVLGEVGRLENATKTRSIRICTKVAYWPFQHIYIIGSSEHFV